MSQLDRLLKVRDLNNLFYNIVTTYFIDNNGLNSLQRELSNMDINSAANQVDEIRFYISNGYIPPRIYRVWDVFNSCTMDQLMFAEQLFI